MGEDTCQLLFDQMINTYLKVMVYGQIDIVASGRLCLRDHFHNTANIIDDQVLIALVPLKLKLHGRLYAGPPYDIVELIFRIALLQFLKLVFLYLAGVADDGGKIDGVFVFPDGRLLNPHPLKLVRMLQDIHHSLLVHIGGDRGGLVFFVSYQGHGIADIDDLERLPVRKDHRIAEFILHLSQLVTVPSDLKGLPRRDVGGIFAFCVVQLVHGLPSVKIPQKAFSRGFRAACVDHLPVFI